jgi:hypothetical protein
MPSGHSPSASKHRVDPAPEPRISLLYWLIVGGTGPPPTKANFRRMVSERKAAYREERAYKEAQKAYQEARKAASAEFKAKWPATSPGAMVGGGERQRLDRRELIRLYGPKGTARRRPHGEHNNDDDRGDREVSHNDNDGHRNNSGNGSNNSSNNNGVEGDNRDEAGISNDGGEG